MKALSLLQPWASLVAVGAKGFETRSWGTNHRGDVAICASAALPKTVLDLCWQDEFSRNFLLSFGIAPHQVQNYCYEARNRCKLLPRGQVIAVANLAEVLKTDGRAISEMSTWRSHARPAEQLFGDYSEGRFAWRLTSVRQLANPISVKGMLGLWTLPADVEKKVMAQL